MTQATDVLSRNSVVSLVEVTKDNVRKVTDLTVMENQEKFVASNAVSIAQAYFEREETWFRAIYAEQTLVGFLLLFFDKKTEKCYLCRFMIDQRYQGFGFGASALQLLFDYLQTNALADKLIVFHTSGEGNPGPFYEKMGFFYTGELDDDALVMHKLLK